MLQEENCNTDLPHNLKHKEKSYFMLCYCNTPYQSVIYCKPNLNAVALLDLGR